MLIYYAVNTETLTFLTAALEPIEKEVEKRKSVAPISIDFFPWQFFAGKQKLRFLQNLLVPLCISRLYM